MLSTHRFLPLAAILFFVFVLWIIVTSDVGAPNFFIDGVRSIPYGDKFGHAILYGVLAVLVSLSLKSPQQKYLGLPLGCALVLLFALIEELTQYFFPTTRMLDLGDALADCVGVYLAAWVCDKLSMK